MSKLNFKINWAEGKREHFELENKVSFIYNKAQIIEFIIELDKYPANMVEIFYTREHMWFIDAYSASNNHSPNALRIKC